VKEFLIRHTLRGGLEIVSRNRKDNRKKVVRRQRKIVDCPGFRGNVFPKTCFVS
jgi:hypothetical protein